MNDLDAYAGRAQALVEQKLEQREQRIIGDVCAKLESGDALSADYAVQAWVALHESRKLMAALRAAERRYTSEQVRKAGA